MPVRKKSPLPPRRGGSPRYIGIDFETTGLYPYHGSRAFSYSLCFEDGSHFVSPRLDGTKKGSTEARSYLQRSILDDPRTELYAHNMKFDWSILLTEGFRFNGNLHCTMIMSQQLRNRCASHALDRLCVELMGYRALVCFRCRKKVSGQVCPNCGPLGDIRDIDKEVTSQASLRKEIDLNQPLGMRGKRFDRVDPWVMHLYEEYDAERLHLLFKGFFPRIQRDQKLYSDYLNEMELVKVTQRMESRGIQLYTDRCGELIRKLTDDAQTARDEIDSIVGDPEFNPASGKQLAKLFYEVYRWEIPYYTVKHSPATDKGALDQLREKYNNPPILDAIERYRAWMKGIATIQGYLDLRDATGAIHPNIKTNHDTTGREACDNPNLQNVPKEGSGRVRYPVLARGCFGARSGFINYHVDYSGIEMRGIADATEEPELIELFRIGGDPHELAASIFYGLIWEDEDKAIAFVKSHDSEFKKLIRERKTSDADIVKRARKGLRGRAKNAQFAIGYGAGMGKVCATLELPIDTGARGYWNYCKRFPLVKSYASRMSDMVMETGGIVTRFGRFLSVNQEEPFAGANYMVQGTCAGILKRAQVRLDKYFQTVWGDRIRMLLPIHDEIVIECPIDLEEKEPEWMREADRLMTEGFPEISVPLAVEWKKTQGSWADAKVYEFNK